jgi:hypothetical protein
VIDPQLSFFQRFAIGVQAFLRSLGDSDFAARVSEPERKLPAHDPSPDVPTQSHARDLRPALQLLSALQREGRLVDFIQQDIATYTDADVGAAARVVHDGCRRSLHAALRLTPVMTEPEGGVVSIAAGYDAHMIRLVGNVGGAPPFRGKLRHKGWRATELKLPDVIDDYDCSVIAPAEVEL